MRLRQLLSFAFLFAMLSSVCQADTVHLAFTGSNNALGGPGGPTCFWCEGPIPGDTYLTLDTHSWSKDVQLGSSTGPVAIGTVRFKSPRDLQAYLNWTTAQGYFCFQPNDNCFNLETWWEGSLGTLTMDGEQPDPNTAMPFLHWFSEPEIKIDTWGPSGLEIMASDAFAIGYQAYYPQHNLWVTGFMYPDPNQQDEYFFADSPSEQTHDAVMTFEVSGQGHVPEPCTALLFAGVAPILLYRSLRRRR